MARRDSVNLDRAIRAVIEESIDRQLARLTRGRPLGDELRDLRSALGRIERRLNAGGPRSAAGAAGRGRPGRPPKHTRCTLEGCNNPHYALGLCSKHYQQERRKKPTKKATKATKAGGRRRKAKTRRAAKTSSR
jgi:hypothetical protein